MDLVSGLFQIIPQIYDLLWFIEWKSSFVHHLYELAFFFSKLSVVTVCSFWSDVPRLPWCNLSFWHDFVSKCPVKGLFVSCLFVSEACSKINYHQHKISLVLSEDYRWLWAQQPEATTTRDDVNKSYLQAVGRAVRSHAGGTPVTGYQSSETNYRTAPNNERTALPILQKIISVPLRLLGSAE